MLTIAIIGAGVMAKILATRAKELNVKTLCFAWAKGAIAKDSVDEFHDIDIFDTNRIIDICKEKNVDGVLATTELTVKIASIVANALGLNTSPLEVMGNITNKSWVRNKGKNFKFIKQPFYKEVTNLDEVIKVESFPVIVKPASYGGKRGITVVFSEDEFQGAINYAKETIGTRNKDGIIIEQFLDKGQEYSVESLSFRKKHFVIQVTQKDSSGAPHCVELGHHQPAALTAEMRKKVETAIKDMLECVGIENGPCHTEIKIIDGEIYLIEINARPGGDCITYPLTELSTGYKFLTGIILAACNVFYDPEFYHSEQKFAGIYFISKQTAHLKPLFDNCDGKPWLYQKNFVSEELQEITHNDATHLNSLIYYADKKIDLGDA
ncbi:ATP-grasp domain-containing protein [Fibrobacter sp. UWH5]|uniref:ATP-grasp domain-containing protein n=1 Tax=Fibrobacter sp. UWH5 TaxID=1896211 RepID=UPI00091B4D6D|nr:ATP-grasp domain-containing protein [Fibrobacter sp. UWH5]SHK68879.1 ATP-grasp domain-containing protein [Fibrobacter sp. UWH5]